MTITTTSPPTSNSKEEEHIDPYMNNLDLDILIVGAGFSGIYLLYNLRKKGYKVKVFEGSNGLGGTWQINRYPGARVDSDQPVYQLSIPQIWKEWTWKEKFPGGEEIRQYFDFCDKILDIKKDVAFNTKVIGANFKKTEGKWMIKTNDGRITKAKYFLPCIGFAAKRYIPDFPGIETFKGKIYHSSEWPKFEVDVSEKRCAVIGTGSSGVQIIQEWGKRAKSLVVFQRTPNLCLPMSSRNLTAEEQNIQKHEYPNYFLRREAHFGGFVFGFLPRDTFDDTEEEREKIFEAI
uniref:Flavin-containing monooxygenase n=1 Tax=Panagrolaimus davidi TaxID=227884 RepID=A0A914QVE2_9BILA